MNKKDKYTLKKVVIILLLSIGVISLQGCTSKSILECISISCVDVDVDIKIDKKEEDIFGKKDENSCNREEDIEINGQVVAGSEVRNATVKIYTWSNKQRKKSATSYGKGKTGEDGSFKIIIDKNIDLEYELFLFVSTGGSFFDRISEERVNIPKDFELYSLVYKEEFNKYIAINTRSRFVKKVVEAKKLKFPKNLSNPWRFGYYSELNETEWNAVNKHKENPNDIREAYVPVKKIDLSKDRTYSLYIDADAICLNYYRKLYNDENINMLNFYKRMDEYLLNLPNMNCLFYEFNLVDTKKTNLCQEHARVWNSIALMTCLGDFI